MDKNTLYKFFDGTATPQEKEAIQLWAEASPEHEKEMLEEHAFFNAVILSRTVNEFSGNETKKKIIPRRSILREILKAVAIIAITVACGSYFYITEKRELQLALNTINVPAGQRVNLILPDGTNVWLNARSQLQYPAVFTGSKREVKLNGEGYFEVTHNSDAPFIVQTSKCSIEVLGTKFNVEAYDDSDDFYTALMEGSVRVTDNKSPSNTLVLSPNYQASYTNGLLSAAPIDYFEIYRWREGLVCFRDIGFGELMKRFEKCYGIRIVIENEKLLKQEFIGKFRISDGIDNALRLLQKDAKYTFERSADDSVIYIK